MINTFYRDGDDGPWSTFDLNVGSPAQNVRVLPSTSTPHTWVVSPQGCVSALGSGCADNRGGLFNNANSTSWTSQGYYDINRDINANMGITGIADYGFDTIGLGAQRSADLKNQTVASVVTLDLWLGLFGLNPKNISFGTSGVPVPSFISNLKSNGSIPSLSFGYNAGAIYRECSQGHDKKGSRSI